LALQQQPVAEEAVAEMTLEKAGEAPKLLVKPEPKVVEQGQTVVFECQATGEPAPEVQGPREYGAASGIYPVNLNLKCLKIKKKLKTYFFKKLAFSVPAHPPRTGKLVRKNLSFYVTDRVYNMFPLVVILCMVLVKR